MKSILNSFLVIATILITGCIPSNAQFLSTQIGTTSVVQTNNSTLVWENTQFPNNTVLTSTSQILPTNFVTPQPTLSANEEEALFIKLLQNNGDCSLPCIWGIQPKGGMDQRAIDYFDRLQQIDSEEFFNIFTYENTNSSNYKSLTILLRKDLIWKYVSLTVDRRSDAPGFTILQGEIDRELNTGPIVNKEPGYLEFPSNPFLQPYWLPNILKSSGIPSNIYIYTAMEDELDRGNEQIIILLTYPEQGFLVGYSFPRKTNEHQFLGCPIESPYFYISSWNPVLNLSLDEIVQNMKGSVLRAPSAHFFKLIEDTTTMTVDEFYETFQQPGLTICLSMDKDIWLLK